MAVMVRATTRYICEKCGKRFADYRQADNCEIGHIVTDATKGFQDDLVQIMKLKFGGHSDDS